MAKLTIIAVIQARMGSSRLPGKMMMEIAGLPLIGHVIQQLQQAKSIDQIILATSNQEEDDCLANYARDNAVAVIRGDPENVLSRFIEADQRFPSDILIRICGDCPFIDGALVDWMVDGLIKSQADCLSFDRPALFGGIEPIRTAAFRRMVAIYHNDPIAMEHVTGCLNHHNPEWLNITTLTLPECWSRPDHIEFNHKPIRLWIDNVSDLEFIRALYALSGVKAGTLALKTIRELLMAHPDLLKINQHVRQKAANDTKTTLLIVTEVGETIGLGHLRRMQLLGTWFKERYSYDVQLVIGGESSCVQGLPFKIHELPETAREQALIKLCKAHTPKIMIIDLKEQETRLEALKQAVPDCLLVLIDDDSPRNMAVDLCFLPPVAKLPKAHVECRHYAGFEWMLLPAHQMPSKPFIANNPPHILITMGGADPDQTSLTLLKTLDELISDQQAFIHCVMGSAMAEPNRQRLKQFCDQSPLSITLVETPENLTDLIDTADLVLCRFGITAYETLARERPLIYSVPENTPQNALSEFKKLVNGLCLEDHPNSLIQALDLVEGKAFRSKLIGFSTMNKTNLTHGCQNIAETIIQFIHV